MRVNFSSTLLSQKGIGPTAKSGPKVIWVWGRWFKMSKLVSEKKSLVFSSVDQQRTEYPLFSDVEYCNIVD